MATDQCITSAFFTHELSRLSRLHAVERLSISSEIKTLMLTAQFASAFLDECLDDLPEDFFSCIEEMKEVLESIDLKSLDLEKRSQKEKLLKGVL